MAARRIALGGLRWRLGAWVALVVLVSSAVTFVVVYRRTGSELRHQIDQEIHGDASDLSHALIASDDIQPTTGSPEGNALYTRSTFQRKLDAAVRDCARRTYELQPA